MIVGYSLAHNQLFAPVFAESLSLLPRVKELGFINDESEAIIGQKCLNAEYQKGGLMGKMDKILYTHLSKDFKYYFASISLANKTSLNFVTNSGYKKVYATETRAYFIIDIKPSELNSDSYETKKPDGTEIHYRFATTGDIAELRQMNSEWMKENRNDLSHGYLAAMFSEDNWKYMIDRKWVVIAEV